MHANIIDKKSLQDQKEMRELRALARRIHSGNCVLVLGPGASTDQTEAEEVPLHHSLARELACDQQVACIEDLNCANLRHVSQVLVERDRNLSLLQETVVDFYNTYRNMTTEFHKKLATLPFQLCITTAPDNFMYNAFKQAEGKTPTRYYYNFKTHLTGHLPEPSISHPMVYHLYGYPEDPESLVITDNDLIDFLVNVIRNEPPLPNLIRGKLSREDTTCLFIDLGFKNWYLRALLKVLGIFGHREMSIALEAPDFFEQSHQHQTTVFFSAARTIQFSKETLSHFSQKLHQAYDAIMKHRHDIPAKNMEGAPRVFLSYASEDREVVYNLANKLRDAAINVWQDKQNLRAGDNWDRVLMQVINKQVDYVIVIQTEAMQKRLEGYFYKEISEATKRQERTKDGFHFLLPVQIGDVKILPELEKLHSHRVDTDTGFSALVSSIAEDWELRGNATAAKA